MTMYAHLYRLIQNTSGDLDMASTSVAVNAPGEDSIIEDTLYSDNAGVDALENPFTITSGVVDFYLADAQRVDLAITIGDTTTVYADVDVLVPITLEEGNEYLGVWDITVTYELGNLVLGSDNFLYVSQVGENVGNDPTTDGGVNWSAKPSSGGGGGGAQIGVFSWGYNSFTDGAGTDPSSFGMSGDPIYTLSEDLTSGTATAACRVASVIDVNVVTNNLTTGQLVIVNVEAGDGEAGNSFNSVMIGNGSPDQFFDFAISSMGNWSDGEDLAPFCNITASDATTGDPIDVSGWVASLNEVLVAESTS